MKTITLIAVAIATLSAGCTIQNDKMARAPIEHRYYVTDPVSRQDVPAQSQEQAIAQLIVLVNLERQKRGLQPLVFDAGLSGVAQSHADAMSRTGKFHHIDAEGNDFRDRMEANGYIAKRGKENLGHGQRSAQLLVSRWMASKAHKAALLDKRSNAIGIGHTSDNYWVAIPYAK
mgnify:CR=1 FL=1